MAPSEPRGWPRRVVWHPKHFHTVYLGATHPYHALGPLNGPLRHSWGPQKGSFRAQMALLGAPKVLGGPRGARFGPNCLPLTRLGWTHLVSGPFWVPGRAKKGYLALIPKFPRPNFVRDIFFFKYRLVGCPEHRSGMPYSSSTVIAHLEPPSSRNIARGTTDPGY